MQTYPVIIFLLHYHDCKPDDLSGAKVNPDRSNLRALVYLNQICTVAVPPQPITLSV